MTTDFNNKKLAKQKNIEITPVLWNQVIKDTTALHFSYWQLRLT